VSPLHAFDRDRLLAVAGGDLSQSASAFAQPRESLKTLDRQHADSTNFANYRQ